MRIRRRTRCAIWLSSPSATGHLYQQRSTGSPTVYATPSRTRGKRGCRGSYRRARSAETETLDKEDTPCPGCPGCAASLRGAIAAAADLASPRAQERWLAAFGLAALHDERALPAIERMLVEFVGPHQPKWGYMFQLWRQWLLRLLAEWGDPRVVPFIRAGLVATVRAKEVAVPEPQGPEQVFVVESTGERYTGQEAWEVVPPGGERVDRSRAPTDLRARPTGRVWRAGRGTHTSRRLLSSDDVEVDR